MRYAMDYKDAIRTNKYRSCDGCQRVCEWSVNRAYQCVYLERKEGIFFDCICHDIMSLTKTELYPLTFDIFTRIVHTRLSSVCCVLISSPRILGPKAVATDKHIYTCVRGKHKRTFEHRAASPCTVAVVLDSMCLMKIKSKIYFFLPSSWI